MEPEAGVLYLVGTPIGNLNDISKRAINVLEKSSLIACEDTRHTRKLLSYLKISNNLISFHEHNKFERIDLIISKLKEKSSVALVSDAGLPLISDPGRFLVKKARESGLEVICIPGPCAALTALVISGLDTSNFAFYGFLPRSNKERLNSIKKISRNDITSIIYESPNRIIKLLEELRIYCGEDRNAVLAKELTKKYEKHFGFSIKQILNQLKNHPIKGEYTLVISGREKDNLNNYTDEILKEDLLNLIKAGLGHSAASNYLAMKSGRQKKEIYKLIL